jgi:hypothetical protein
MFFTILLLPLFYGKLLYLTRHAEKPNFKSSELSSGGFKRAHCLRELFLLQKQGLKTPQRIIAQPVGNVKKSKRPIQTAQPLAKALKISIELDCGPEDYECLQEIIIKDEKTTLLIWEHKRLQKIAALFIDKRLKYPKDRFDLIWVIDTNKGILLEIIQEDCKFLMEGSIESTILNIGEDLSLGDFLSKKF